MQNESEVVDRFMYLLPFLGMGAAGGIIRELNTKTFSWRELCVRAITGAFGAALAGLYLRHMPYDIEMQYAIAGAIGATACELIQAVQKWIIRKVGGGQLEEDFDVSLRMDTSDSVIIADDMCDDVHNTTEDDNRSKRSSKRSRKKDRRTDTEGETE